MTAMSIFMVGFNVEYFAMNNWSFLQSGSIGIDRKDIEKVFTGRTVLSSIYQDQRTKQNVMSLLTPQICRRAAKRDCAAGY